MPVSGLVVSLSQDPQLRAEAIDAINREPNITVGVREGNRLAIVLDTDSSQEDRQIWDRLDSHPGVVLLEVAFVGFDPQGSQQQDAPRRDSPRRGPHVSDEAEQAPTATTRKSMSGNKDHRNDGC